MISGKNHGNVFEFHFQNVANAVLAFAHATDAYHREVCNGKPGICKNMKILAGTNGVASRLYHYLEKVSFTGYSINISLFIVSLSVKYTLK